MKLGTSLYTLFFGKAVGEDKFGNRYFEQKRQGKRAKRWVLYRGVAEPSKVPPEWHGWLHHIELSPPDSSQNAYTWQKPHRPNMTGTPGAYFPPGSVLAGGQRDKATGDYEPWQP